MYAQELITITSPTAITVFEPGDTFSIDVELGGEAADLLMSNPTTPLLTSTFSLSNAELTIEAVAPPGSDTDAAAVRGGIVIGLPRAAYDSIAGETGLGGVTTADGLRLEVRDSASNPARIYFLDDRSVQSAQTQYSPLGGEDGVALSHLTPLGSTHIATFAFLTFQHQPPSLQQVFQFIQAHEITIAPGYSGGAFNLRLTLAESSRGVDAIGARDTVTAEILIRGGAAGVIVPSDRAVNVVAGDTLATLTWTVAQNRRTLEATDVQYQATLTETVSGVSSAFTMSSSDYTLNDVGTMASFTLDRAMAVLLPGKSYELTMLACDSGNCSAQQYSGTFQTTSARPDTNEDEIHDELAGVVTPSISRYCSNVDGGNDHADSDGDGVPDNVEVRIGTDCRSGAANDFVGASRPVITISSMGVIVETVGGEDYFIHPGTGAMTEVAAGVSCTGCEAGLSAYRDTTLGNNEGTTVLGACIGDTPGFAGRAMLVCSPLEVNDDKVMLGSFSQSVLWVAEDANGNWTTQVQRFYIQPRVGFSVSEVRTEGGTAGLPVSVAVSSDVQQSFAVEVAPAVGGVSSTVNIESRRAVVNVQITPTAGTPGEATLSFPPGSQMTTPAPAPDLMDNDLYTLGISTVTVSLLTTPTTTEPAFAFTPQPPLFVDDDAGSLTFRIASTPSAAMYEVTAEILQPHRASSLLTVEPSMVTAGQDAVVSFGDNIQAGDIIEVKATGTMADQEDFVGTFFVSVVRERSADSGGNGIPETRESMDRPTHELQIIRDDSYLEVSEGMAALGGYASVASSVTFTTYSAAIPDDNPEANEATGIEPRRPPGYQGTGVFDFIVTGVTPGGVVSVLIPLRSSVTQTGLRLFKYDNDDGGGWNPFTSTPPDAYYGAPLPCPAINAPRGAGEGEWRPADDTGLQEGDGCLLLEITDGGPNDADGTRNGVIYDPNALGSGGGSAGLGGGTMDPTWLLLLALAMALSYASRRRQRQFPL